MNRFHADPIARFGGREGIRDPGLCAANYLRPQAGF